MELFHLSRVVNTFKHMAVARFACFKIRKELLAQGLATDEEIVYSLLICRKCSQKLIPGVNCRVAIGGKKKRFKNTAVYLCKGCGHKTKFGGVGKGVRYARLEKSEPRKEKAKLEGLYEVGLRTLSKEGKKRSLLDSFFESAQSESLYKIFKK